MANLTHNYVMFGNTSGPSRARFVEAVIVTGAKIHHIWAPYGMTKGCRIEYLIAMSMDKLEEFKKIAKPGHIEIQGELRVN